MHRARNIGATISFVIFLLSGCGGGGSSAPPATAPPPSSSSGTSSAGPVLDLPAAAPATSTVPSGYTKARFKDADVVGLNYVAGSTSGVSAPDGSFVYQKGGSVEFSVGAVPLGSLGPLQTALGNSAFTVVDLVSNGSTSLPAVINRVRFLMMLDEDGNPDNGISISTAVQAAAAGWSPVDFQTTDLPQELASIMSEVSNVDNRTATLPDALTAQSHIEQTLRCVRGGAFVGTFDGDVSGRLFLAASVKNGGVAGEIYSDQLNGAGDLIGGDAIAMDLNGAFTALSLSQGMVFVGTYYDNDSVFGLWSNSVSGTSGTFQASRVGGEDSAIYRYVAIYTGTDNGFLTYDIFAGGAMTVTKYSIKSDSYEVETDALGDGTLTTKMPSGFQVQAFIDPTEQVIQGLWYVAYSTGTGVVTGHGCRLN